jgi:hypothetical protein
MPYTKKITPAGTRFASLTVLVDRRPGEPVQCVCECGTPVVARYSALTSGNTRSCGCLQRRVTGDRTRIHGKRNDPVYDVWQNMISRCTKPQHRQWPDYGGRGITVCEKWRTFAGFYEDMGDPPSGMTIDRINNDLGYEPGNCRWATPSEQARNRRATALTANRARDPLSGRIISTREQS